MVASFHKVVGELDRIAIASAPSRTYPNQARSLGNRLGVRQDALCHMRAAGGDMVQAVTNLMADRIAKGKDGVIMIAQAMTAESQRAYNRKFPGSKVEILKSWSDDPGVGPPEMSGNEHDGVRSHPEPFHSDEERRHGLSAPIHIYPVIEQALRGRYGAPVAQHQKKIATMMHEFSKVAASQPEYAWIPEVRGVEEIAYPNEKNRWIGFPYTKYMNANDNVDGAACWLMCSLGTAKKLGIREEKWVYQHAGAHAHEGTEQWFSLPKQAI